MMKLKHPQILTGLAILSTCMPLKANAQTVATETKEDRVCASDTLVWPDPGHAERRMKQYGGFNYDGAFTSGIVDCYWSGELKDQDFDKLNPGKWKSLCENIRNNSPVVRRLPLNGYNFSTNQINELLGALKENKSVEYLDLKNTSLQPADISRLLDIVKNNPNLKGLDLSGDPMTWRTVQDVGNFLRDNKSLETLFMGKPIWDPLAVSDEPDPEPVRINGMFLQPITERLYRNTTLKTLGFPDWDMSFDALVELCRSLKWNKGLENLDLQNVKVGQSKPANYLVLTDFYLSGDHPLKRLNVSGCEFGPGFGAAMAKALEKNTHLEALYAWNNNFGPKDYRAIANMLFKNETLRELHSDGKFDDEAMILLAHSMGKNFSLESADFIDRGQMPSRIAQTLNFAEGFNRKYHAALNDPNATTLPYMNADIVNEYGSAMQKLVFDNFVSIKSYLKDNPDKKLSNYLETNFGISHSPAVKQNEASR